MHQSFEGHHRDVERVAELSKAVEISVGYGFFEPSVSVVFEGSSSLDRVLKVVSGTRGVMHDVDVVAACVSDFTEPVDVFGDGPREVVFDGGEADGERVFDVFDGGFERASATVVVVGEGGISGCADQLIDGLVFELAGDVPKAVVESAEPSRHGEDVASGMSEFRFESFPIERVLADGEMSEVFEIDGTHRGVACVADSTDTFDTFIGEDVKDVVFAWPWACWTGTPDFTVAEDLGFEIEERGLGRQLEDGESDVCDFQSTRFRN